MMGSTRAAGIVLSSLLVTTNLLPAQTVTFSLKAVAVDGVPIEPTNVVAVPPGGVLTTEVFVSNWSPNGERIRLLEVAIDEAGYSTAYSGELSQPHIFVQCYFVGCGGDDLNCTGLFECICDGGCCVSCELLDWVFVDDARADYVFAGAENRTHVAPSPPRASAGVDAADAVDYAAPPKYVSTFRFNVSTDACGTFDLDLLHAGATVSSGVDLPATLEPLRVHTVIAAGPDRITATEPANCSVDPFQPTDLDATPFSHNTVVAAFDRAVDQSMAAGIEVLTVPPGQPELQFNVTASGNELVIRLLSEPPAGVWTCVRSSVAGWEVCSGSLPGDFDRDRVVTVRDLAALARVLSDHGEVSLFDPLRFWRGFPCDINRSGSCTPADLLREIDLLNGAEPFGEWLGATLPPCPSCP